MKDCIIVLGMHRSGTSAATGVLSLLGGDIGATVMETNPMNPRGFFENQRLRLLNDRLLETLGASWETPYALVEGWEETGELAPLAAAVGVALAEEFDGGRLPLIKDPRLCVTLAFWQPLFNAAGLAPGYVVVVRHPREAADSLTAAYGFTWEKGALLWMRHMLAAEAATRGRPRVFVCFNDLLSNPRQYQERVAAGLGIKFPRPWDRAESDVADFLDPGLKHHHRREARKVTPALGPVLAAHDILCRLARDPDPADEAAHRAALDDLRRRFYADLRLFYHRDILHPTATDPPPGGTQEGPREADAVIRGLEQGLAARGRLLDRWAAFGREVTDALVRSRDDTARLQETLDELTSSRAWRLAQLYRKWVYGWRVKK